jgi:cobalamin biosynthesis Co2+ chelatase CbiK
MVSAFEDISRRCQIVLAAFGTSMDSSAIYVKLQERFEERFAQKIPIGFTSRVGNPKLKTVLEGISSEEGLEIVITPLFMIPGKVVIDDIKKVAGEYQHHFKSIKVAKPLLPDDRVYHVLKEEILPDIKKSKCDKKGILFVGHGTPDRNSSYSYSDFAQNIKSVFPPSIKIAFGNVEFSDPYCKDILGEIVMSDIRTLVVQPLMIVDGVHIHEDIKGVLDGGHDGNKLYHHLLDTYGEPIKKRLREITFVYKPGLGAYRGIFELFADHTIRALSADEFL